MSQAIERPIHWLPCAVDTLRFTPYPDAPARTIDVYSIGRRREGIHKQLLFRRPGAEKYSISTTHFKAPWRTRTTIGSIVITSRMSQSEADALWQRPERSMRLQNIKANLKWDIVIVRDLPPAQFYLDKHRMVKHSGECFPGKLRSYELNLMGDVMDVLAELASDPARVSAASRRNAVDALLHHDWVYRWKEVLKVAGLEPSPGMLARESRLKELAAMIADPIEAAALAQKSYRSL